MVLKVLLVCMCMHAQARIVAPEVVEYFPEGHSMHSVAVVAPEVVEYFPEGHSMHSVAPDVSEYWPGSHALQEYASAPEAPGTQAQLSDDVLPDGEVESGGHASQNADIEMKPATQR
jgi:hypothetical protein